MGKQRFLPELRASQLSAVWDGGWKEDADDEGQIRKHVSAFQPAWRGRVQSSDSYITEKKHPSVA